MRVLLVEDDLLLGKATRKGLETRGYTVDWIRDGVSAEAAIAAHDYEAILLDLGLPRQDCHADAFYTAADKARLEAAA